MTKTQNYELNIVEGTDKVNPLVVDNPNFSKIDAVMKKNADSAITTATELKTGTVHTLTRVNKECPVFRFVATAVFTTGDTFTVDGVQVTALLTDGTPLVSGCYVIGANVLCCLTGTTLSVYVAQNLSGVTVDNSEKLGGNLPNYYGTASAVATAQETAENANEIALALKNSLTTQSNVLTPLVSLESGSGIVEQSGNIVSLRLSNLVLETASSSVTLFKLPEHLRVKSDFSTIKIHTAQASSSPMPCIIYLGTNGNVTVVAMNWSGQSGPSKLYLDCVINWIA